MTREASDQTSVQVLKPGHRLYDEDGAEVGTVQAITDSGVEVNTHDAIDMLSLEHAPGHDLGERYLVWCCSNCGEFGDIEDIPEVCPNCERLREELYTYLVD